jgi:acyl carrier protein
VIKFLMDFQRTDDVPASTARFEEDLGMDSLDLIEMIMEAELEFDVEISDSVAEKFTTVADLIAFIDKTKR